MVISGALMRQGLRCGRGGGRPIVRQTDPVAAEHPLDDQVALELGDGADDHHHR